MFAVKAIPIMLLLLHLSFGRRYDNYALYRLHPENGEHVRFLQDLQVHKYIDVDFWNYPNTRNVLVMVNRSDREMFKERTMHFDIKNKLVFDNVQKVFDQQYAKDTPLRHYRNRYEYFHSLDDIYSWLHEIAAANPTLTVLETIGKTYENRSILALTIKRPRSDAFGIIVEAGAHGHEWISTCFAIFLIDQLLTSTYGPISTLRGSYQWYIIPVLNPDGYVYAQNQDRLWRKNRRVYNNGKSVGVDLNRNFPYSWGVHDSSPEPDDDNYYGPSPISELETEALYNYVRRRRDLLLYYFSIHGFGQKFLIPFGDKSAHVGNFDTVQSVIKDATDKIYGYSGRKYYSGTAFEMLGAKISGDSASWVKATFGTPYVMTILPRDNGLFGHALPPNQTLPACRELMLAMTALLKYRQSHYEARVYLEKAALMNADNNKAKRPASSISIFFIAISLKLKQLV